MPYNVITRRKEAMTRATKPTNRLISQSRVFTYAGVECLAGRHFRPYRLMCDGIEMSRHFTERGAREALRVFDLDILAWDAELAATHGPERALIRAPQPRRGYRQTLTAAAARAFA